MIGTLLLLGATGDLARRFVLPALGVLEQSGRLGNGVRVVGAARQALGAEAVRQLVDDALPVDRFSYRPVDLADSGSLRAVLAGTAGPVAAYLALPPDLFATTITSLTASGLPAGSRVAVEKPFGHDLESARTLNALLAQSGCDPYRVDHVLAMETTRNLLAFRRDHPELERMWNGERTERVDILWEETLALEGRGGYYDRAGALKDVLQNHMLQLLALTAMELPSLDGDDGDLHQRKLDVLRSARVLPCSRRARYTAGRLADGRAVGAYADDDGVDAARGTETLVEVSLELDLRRWRGTRFRLRAGKALARRRKLVLVHFRTGGELEIGIDGPDDVVLRPGEIVREPQELSAPARDGLPPYAHVLRDVLDGTSTFSVGGEEAEQAWCVVAPVLAAWEADEVTLEEYPAGSAGPPAW
jgi:glucose-6-phosphate 1-dehydrogenase